MVMELKNKTMLRTLYAKRNKSNVDVFNEEGKLKGTFTNKGYRPTKATKEITFNCWKWKLEWI
jgi:hypothetical protein